MGTSGLVALFGLVMQDFHHPSSSIEVKGQIISEDVQKYPNITQGGPKKKDKKDGKVFELGIEIQMKLKYFNFKLEVYNLWYSMYIHNVLDIAGPCSIQDTYSV